MGKMSTSLEFRILFPNAFITGNVFDYIVHYSMDTLSRGVYLGLSLCQLR